MTDEKLIDEAIENIPAVVRCEISFDNHYLANGFYASGFFIR
jgi:hypothetical protein